MDAMKDTLFIWLQHLVPQHLISRLVGKLAACRWAPVKNTFIRWFSHRYQIDMSEAEQSDPLAFDCFNAFFTRALKADARPLPADERLIVSPADGQLSQFGAIEHDQLLQAKGRHFSLQALLGGDAALAEQFQDGSFATIYLAPRDYHRFHMPLAGVLRETIYVPGRLFSVNKVTAEGVDRLFARNERLVCVFDTDHGPMALVLVGAMIVAGIDTVWAGQAAPARHGLLRTSYTEHSPPVMLARGAEVGRFKLGSTVIAVFGPGMASFAKDMDPDLTVRMGQPLGTV